MRSLRGLCAIPCILGSLLLTGCSGANPSPSPAGPTLDLSVPVPAHAYSVTLPTGWTSTLGSGPTDPDVFTGPQGKLTVIDVPIPAGQGAQAWADFYADARAPDFAAGCFAGGGAKADTVSVGQAQGLLYGVACLPGWMAIVANGDHGYDIRFVDASGGQSDAGRTLFTAILRGLVLQ